MSDVRREVEPLPASGERTNQLRRRLRHEARTLGEGGSGAGMACATVGRATQAAIVRGLPGVSATTDSVRPDDGRAPDGSIRHILLVAYLYPPCNAVSAHRPAGLRRAFESAGIRTTVLTSEISGSYDDDEAQRIIRAGDLRTRFRTQYQTLVGYRDGPLEARGKPRWWTNYIVPDPTAVSWFPQALVQLLRLIRNDRPDVIVTTSGPESSHLLGLVASAFGIRWVADYRDDWLRDVRHPAPLRVIDRALERQIARRSTIVTAVNDAIAADVEQRHGVRAFTDLQRVRPDSPRRRVGRASDPRPNSLLARLHRAARDGRRRAAGGQSRAGTRETFLDALTLLLAKDPSFATRLELVVAGPISDSEREVLTRGELRNDRASARVAAARPRTRPPAGRQTVSCSSPAAPVRRPRRSTSTSRRSKPIFAVTEHDGVAAELLRDAGEHTVAEAGDAESLAAALQTYLTRWTGAAVPATPRLRSRCIRIREPRTEAPAAGHRGPAQRTAALSSINSRLY